MLRKRFRRHLSFESLESVFLLSGGIGPKHAGAAAVVAKAAKAAVPVRLSGSAIGSYHFGRSIGTPVNFSAVGLIKPLGHLTLKGSMLLGIQNPTGRVTISTGHGKVFATLNASSPGDLFAFEITGGTGKWLHAAGTGNALISTVPSKARGSTHGRFGITFLNLNAV